MHGNYYPGAYEMVFVGAKRAVWEEANDSLETWQFHPNKPDSGPMKPFRSSGHREEVLGVDRCANVVQDFCNV